MRNYSSEEIRVRLLCSLEHCDLQLFESLVNNNDINLNSINRHNDTFLIISARLGCVEIVDLLLSKNVNIDAVNLHGDNALIAAAEKNNNMKIINKLINYGININHTNILGRTALIEAASIGDIENVETLLNAKADVNIVTDEEETALTFAIVNEYAEIVKKLLISGAKVKWVDKHGWSPLTYAINSGNKLIIEMLMTEEYRFVKT